MGDSPEKMGRRQIQDGKPWVPSGPDLSNCWPCDLEGAFEPCEPASSPGGREEDCCYFPGMLGD